MRTSEKKHWDDFWASSQELRDVYGTDGRIVDNLARFVDVSGMSIVEVGAGTGRDTELLAQRGGRACALDYSEESLNLMRGNIDHVDIVCGDALALPFASESFDLVFHQGLLEHFRNPGALVDENVRILKRGGILLVDVPQRYHYYTVAKHLLIAVGKWFAGWETEFSARQLRGLIEARGLQVIGMYGHNPSPPIWYRGVRRVLLKAGVRLPMYPRAPGFLRATGRVLGSAVPESWRLNTAMVIGCIARKP